MEGLPHGFMGRGFPPRMRGGPPRFGGPPGGVPGNMNNSGPPTPRRWSEEERPPRRSRWSSAPDSAVQNLEALPSESEMSHELEDKQSEPEMTPGAEELSAEFPPKDFSSSDPPAEFTPDEEPVSEFAEGAEFDEENDVSGNSVYDAGIN